MTGRTVLVFGATGKLGRCAGERFRDMGVGTKK